MTLQNHKTKSNDLSLEIKTEVAEIARDGVANLKKNPIATKPKSKVARIFTKISRG